jgi:TatD DNase family protein
MFDTHVNLHAEAFADDLDAVLARAAEAGVSRMLAICDRFDHFGRVKEIAGAADNIYATVGTHPHHAKDFPDLTAEALIEAADNPNVVAIGETGLDQHYGYSSLEAQVAGLKTHIKAAQETGLPIVIHTREADRETAEILEEAHAERPFSILLHCYTGGHDLARRGLALGAFVSVSGILSFKNAHDVRDVISNVPLERIIVETDCPYLAPVPMRGRRNEPAYLPHVIAALARLKDESPEDVARITEANALSLFARVPA